MNRGNVTTPLTEAKKGPQERSTEEARCLFEVIKTCHEPCNLKRGNSTDTEKVRDVSSETWGGEQILCSQAFTFITDYYRQIQVVCIDRLDVTKQTGTRTRVELCNTWETSTSMRFLANAPSSFATTRGHKPIDWSSRRALVAIFARLSGARGKNFSVIARPDGL